MGRRIELTASGVGKKFGLRTIFSRIEFSVGTGDRLGVTGRNGSGKSTLMKIIAGVAESSAGTISYSVDEEPLKDGRHIGHVGFVSPYLQLYTEFTAWEHVQMMQRMRGLAFDPGVALELFERFGLERRVHDELHTFSSGMLQRAKFICALIHHPHFLLLDEPMTNLDEAGMNEVRAIVMERSEHGVVLIATNDVQDLEMTTHLLSVERATFVERTRA